MNKILAAAARSIANTASAKILANRATTLALSVSHQTGTSGSTSAPRSADALITLLETVEALLVQTSERSHLLQLLCADNAAAIIAELNMELHPSDAQVEAMLDAVEHDRRSRFLAVKRLVAATGTKFDVQSQCVCPASAASLDVR
nr:hypothetical protein HK105_000549 [Polyrhizophydium stewartii]